MSRRNPDKNTHHKVGLCNEKWFKVKEDANLMLVDVLQHDSRNNIWDNKQDFQSQLQEMKDKRYSDIISEEAKILLDLLIYMPKFKFYRKDLVKALDKKKQMNIK